MIKDVDEKPVRALFLDPDVMLDAAKVAAGWTSADLPEGADPARSVFVRSIDPAAIARLNSVLGRVPDMVVVIASHWRLLWPVAAIASMLQEAGYRGTRFSACHVDRKVTPTAWAPSWVKAQRDVGREVHYAIWADECPAEELTRWTTGAPRTIQLLLGIEN